MAWTQVGSVTVRPETAEVVVGRLDVPAQGGIELMVRQTSPAQPFKFAYGLVSFRSSYGKELGTVKCWADDEWTAFYLGENLSARDGSGELVFEPRSYNLRWVKAGYPWTLEFLADVKSALPLDRFEAPGFVSDLDRLLPLVRVGSQGRIQF